MQPAGLLVLATVGLLMRLLHVTQDGEFDKDGCEFEEDEVMAEVEVEEGTVQMAAPAAAGPPAKVCSCAAKVFSCADYQMFACDDEFRPSSGALPFWTYHCLSITHCHVTCRPPRVPR